MIATAAAPPRSIGGDPLSLDMLPRLLPLLAERNALLSEYSLANLYLYRRRHDYHYAEDPVPHVRGVAYDGERHALPLAPITREDAMALLERCDCIGPLGDDGPRLAEDLGLDVHWNEDDSDYVYQADRLARLEAAKAKRLRARAFEQEHSPRFHRLTDEHIAIADQVLAGWFDDVGRSIEDTDLSECREALRLRTRLGLEGWLVSLPDGPVAFMLAGRGGQGSRIVHFAKGRRLYDGAYPWMFAQFAAQAGTCLINFEQDLGKPGFAQAKRAFAPIMKLRKHRLRKTR